MAGPLAVVLLVVGAHGSSSQEIGGISGTVTASTQFVLEDGDSFARAALGADWSSTTRTSALNLSLNLGYDTQDGGTVDGSAAVDYTRQSANASLSFGANLSREDVDNASSVDLGTGLINGDGTQTVSNVTLGWAWGLDAPLGVTADLGYRTIRYDNVTDASLVDSDQFSFSSGLILRPDRATQIRFSTTFSDTDRVGGTDTRNWQLAASVERELANGIRPRLALGFRSVDSTDTLGVTTTEDGLSFDLGVTVARPTGPVTIALGSDLGENGRRSSLTLGKVRELPAGRISAQVGLSYDNESGQTDPTFALSYVRELPRGQFSANLDQSFQTASDGDEIRNSSASLRLSQQLTPLTQLNTTLSYAETETIEGVASEDSRRSLRMGLDRRLTENWSAFGGIAFVEESSTSSADSTDEQFFLGLRTNQPWRR